MAPLNYMTIRNGQFNEATYSIFYKIRDDFDFYLVVEFPKYKKLDI